MAAQDTVPPKAVFQRAIQAADKVGRPPAAACGSGAKVAASKLPVDGLTRVELTYVPDRVEQWIRFGRCETDRFVGPHERVLTFAPGSIFALVRWAANDYGTILSRIDIVRALKPGAASQRLPFMRPGGEILLRLAGWPKVEKVLRLIDGVEMLGIEPPDVAPHYWRHVHNRMAIALAARSYGRLQHYAWLRQKELWS